MRTHADASDARLPAVAFNYGLKPVLGQRVTIMGKEDMVVPRASWVGTIAIDVLPDCLLYLSPDGHQSLSAPLPPYLKQATLKVDIWESQSIELVAADSGIKKGEHDGIIPVADR
jgi:hypothetical protein